MIGAAGRFVTALAVRPESRRRGVARALLAAVRAGAPGKLRLCDHPGNYVSPGVDVRYQDARAWLHACGFRPLPEVENIRAPLDGNPLISAERSATLDQVVIAQGYRIRRVGDGYALVVDTPGFQAGSAQLVVQRLEPCPAGAKSLT